VSRGRSGRRLANWQIGLVIVIAVAVGSFLAYTKQLPWSHGYEIKAVFTSAENIRTKSPVRIAGVEVGEVTSVEPLTSDSPDFQAATGGQASPPSNQPPGQQAAVVTMEINDEGRPIHEDATFKLRPRLFLEGNLFVDLQPGSPESPEAHDGHVFPSAQTSTSVQLDQVLTTLQAGVRKNLQIFLKEFGNSLTKYGGAKGFQALYTTSPGAFKNTSLVNEAFLGTHPHDLSGLVKNLDSTVRALDENESALQGLVVNLRTVTGSFAAQDQALEDAIAELPNVLDAAHPAFVHLNEAFPPLRAFAREALPGTRTAPAALEAATPFLHQLRGLVSRRELRGLVHDLRPTVPDLARLSRNSVPFLKQSRALASCFNEVIIPWSNNTVKPGAGYPAAAQPKGKVFQETGYGLAGIAGESRSGDANGQYVRVLASGGPNTVVFPGADNAFGQKAVGLTPFPILGAMPKISDSAKTPFRPDVRCETQQQPDLHAGVGSPPQQMKASSPTLSPQYGNLLNQLNSVGKDAGLPEHGNASPAQIRKVNSEYQSVLDHVDRQIGHLGGGG